MDHRFSVAGNTLSVQQVSHKKRGLHQNHRNWCLSSAICGHRWLEDKQVSYRKTLTSLASHHYLCHWAIKKHRSVIPAVSSFTTLRSAVQDGLITAQLEFFVSTAVIMKPYLQMFESDAPAYLSSPLKYRSCWRLWSVNLWNGKSFRLQILLWRLPNLMC